MEFLLALATIIVAAKGSGLATTSLGLPAVLGELMIGLTLGPAFVGLHLKALSAHLAHLGVLLHMFTAGLGVDLKALHWRGYPLCWPGHCEQLCRLYPAQH